MTKPRAFFLSPALCLSLLSACAPPSAPTTCNPACDTGSTCSAGTCVPLQAPLPDLAVLVAPADLAVPSCAPACSGLLPHCNAANHQCVACLADADCPAGTYCHGSACVPGCTTDDRCKGGGGAAPACCGMLCVDTSTDADNCGGCGKPCQAAHAASTCKNGVCGLGACSNNFGDCNMNAADGCEANLTSDAANCGACGKVCKLANATTGCAHGCYLRSCNYGYDDCNGDPTDGCEASVIADPKNCGSCGKTCSAPNAKTGCSLAACVISSCNQGWLDCDGQYANGCEVVGATDLNNCGACGNVCPKGLACINGGCTCNGCNLANAKTACIMNMCVLQSCLAGYGDCDKNLKNGCEADLTMDPNNCGACGNVCPKGAPFCSNSACVVTPPCQGWTFNGGCWYTSQLGQSCSAFCQGHGGFDAGHQAHAGNPVCVHYYPQKAMGNNWMPTECCSTDNNTNWGATGAMPDPNWTFAACYLACACMN